MNIGSNLFSLMQIHERKFTKAEKKVADYVFQHPEEAIHMTITSLAEQCGVGDTTVFRFCKLLKLKGYQEFKMLLARSLTNKREVELTLNDNIGLGDSILDICKKLYQEDVSALKDTMELMREEDVRTVAEWMERARLIHFFGAGSSGTIAQMAKAKFSRILPNVIFDADLHIQTMTASILNEQDLAFGVSYSGSTKDTIAVLQLAKKRGAKTVCITGSAASPIARYADIMLLYRGSEGPFQGGSLLSAIPQLYLLDVLYTEYFKRTYGNSSANKATTTEAIMEKLV